MTTVAEAGIPGLFETLMSGNYGNDGTWMGAGAPPTGYVNPVAPNYDDRQNILDMLYANTFDARKNAYNALYPNGAPAATLNPSLSFLGGTGAPAATPAVATPAQTTDANQAILNTYGQPQIMNALSNGYSTTGAPLQTPTQTQLNAVPNPVQKQIDAANQVILNAYGQPQIMNALSSGYSTTGAQPGSNSGATPANVPTYVDPASVTPMQMQAGYGGPTNGGGDSTRGMPQWGGYGFPAGGSVDDRFSRVGGMGGLGGVQQQENSNAAPVRQNFSGWGNGSGWNTFGR